MRKGQNKPKDFESMGGSGDAFARIYESMLISPAFLDLSKNQRLLYVCMKAQWYGKRKPRKDYEGVEGLQGDDVFYFPRTSAERYGLYTRNNHKQLSKDIEALQEKGFIETVASGKATFKKSIYRFSDHWRTWRDG